MLQPDLVKLNIAELIPELRTALRPYFSSVHCDLSACPSLNQAPFNLPVQGLGQLLCIVPDTVSQDEAAKQIDAGVVLSTCNGFHVVTDGKSPHQVLRLMLSAPATTASARAVGGCSAGTTDWRQPIRQFFNARLGINCWALVTACRGTIGLLRTETAPAENSKGSSEQQQKNVMVWLAPVSQRITPTVAKKTVKKKIVRKVLRKSSNNSSKAGSPEKNGGSPGPAEQQPQSPTSSANGTAEVVIKNAVVGTGAGGTSSSSSGGKSVSSIIAGRMASLFNNCAGSSSSNGTTTTTAAQVGEEENGHNDDDGDGRGESNGDGTATNAKERANVKDGTSGIGNGTITSAKKRAIAKNHAEDEPVVHEISVARFCDDDDEHADQDNEPTSSSSHSTAATISDDQKATTNGREGRSIDNAYGDNNADHYDNSDGGDQHHQSSGATAAAATQAQQAVPGTPVVDGGGMAQQHQQHHSAAAADAELEKKPVADDQKHKTTLVEQMAQHAAGDQLEEAGKVGQKMPKDAAADPTSNLDRDNPLKTGDKRVMVEETVSKHSAADRTAATAPSLTNGGMTNGVAASAVGGTLRNNSGDNGRAFNAQRRPSASGEGSGTGTFGQATRAGSTPSPPTGSESPCSFLSATSGGTTSETLISRRFRREDAPSPSVSSVLTGAAVMGGTAPPQQQQQMASSSSCSAATSSRRSATAAMAAATTALTNGGSVSAGFGGVIGSGGTNCYSAIGSTGSVPISRLTMMNAGGIGAYPHHQLNVLSPISSCGSVSEETERDFRSARDELTSTTITNMAAGEEEEEEDDDDDDQTLMLLAHHQRQQQQQRRTGRRSGSPERSLTGGLELDEASMRDDFSLMSTVSSQAAQQRPTQRTVTTFGVGGGGTMPSALGAVVGTTAGRFHSSSATAAAARMDDAPASNRGFSSSSRWSGRRRSSPSPSQKGSRTALDALAASSATSPQPAQFVSGMIGFRMPVTVLLQTLGLLSYKELSELRRVHPHWDELCGQLLNQGYYQLIGRAQWLLTESQRKLNREPRLAQPIQLLTRLHVHVLNPVDAMRSFLDEGVLCFPYGALLDRALAMLGQIEDIVTCGAGEQISYDQASDQLDQLQELARRANVHYRQVVEPEAEKRMSEMYRLSAQQRLQRLDSFLVESSMSRVERESEKARNDMRWELEQLKELNVQLKKDNRELKHLCVRLDGRVDVLERKFKTMARLLQ